jgi:hypothetical protein
MGECGQLTNKGSPRPSRGHDYVIEASKIFSSWVTAMNGGLLLDGEFALQIHNDAGTLGIQSGVQPVHNKQGSPSAIPIKSGGAPARCRIFS